MGYFSRVGGKLVCLLAIVTLSGNLHAKGEVARHGRLQELLNGEVQYHYYRKDYLSAITQLQLAQEKISSLSPAEMEILHVKLKLAYGLADQAGAELTLLQQEHLPNDTANRAWYDLARTLFHKGRPEAALKAINNLRGEPPKEIHGELQLLKSNVLIALKRYPEAARVLAEWRGPQALAGYAYYNRGIALMRTGEYQAAADALERVTELVAEQEEILALKDKANLTLGNLQLQQENLEQARLRFGQVRQQGPFSNQALLASGLVAQMQGRDEEALGSWMVLRGRMSFDPAVQESLLAVPYLQHQRGSPEMAASNYEQAVAALSRELYQVNDAVRSVERLEDLDQIMYRKIAPEEGAYRSVNRYLESLLASRVFQETARGYRDLQAMLNEVDEGLRSIGKMKEAVPPPSASEKLRPGDRHVPKVAGKALDSAPENKRQSEGTLPESARRGWNHDDVLAWEGANRSGPSSRGIPLLPQLKLPSEQALKPLPGSGAVGLPPAPEDIGLPPAPEDIGLPLASGAQGLPPAPEDIGLPTVGGWRNLERDDGDGGGYTEKLTSYEKRTEPSRRLLRRIMRSGRNKEQDEDGAWMEKELSELATSLGHTTERMALMVRKLRANEVRDKMLLSRIKALRERIVQLRARIGIAMGHYEEYARLLALVELKRRRGQLEEYLEYARLELAKSYDSATVE